MKSVKVDGKIVSIQADNGQFTFPVTERDDGTITWGEGRVRIEAKGLAQTWVELPYSEFANEEDAHRHLAGRCHLPKPKRG